jgi:hypothetical protein
MKIMQIESNGSPLDVNEGVVVLSVNLDSKNYNLLYTKWYSHSDYSGYLVQLDPI